MKTYKNSTATFFPVILAFAATCSSIAYTSSIDDLNEFPSISVYQYANESKCTPAYVTEAFYNEVKVSSREIAEEVSWKMKGLTREEYVSYEEELKRFSTPVGINIFEVF